MLRPRSGPAPLRREAGLLPCAAPSGLQARLPQLLLAPLRLYNKERSAAEIFSLIDVFLLLDFGRSHVGWSYLLIVFRHRRVKFQCSGAKARTVRFLARSWNGMAREG